MRPANPFAQSGQGVFLASGGDRYYGADCLRDMELALFSMEISHVCFGTTVDAVVPSGQFLVVYCRVGLIP